MRSPVLLSFKERDAGRTDRPEESEPPSAFELRDPARRRGCSSTTPPEVERPCRKSVWRASIGWKHLTRNWVDCFSYLQSQSTRGVTIDQIGWDGGYGPHVTPGRVR